ncbi:DMT family transporter [Nocardia lijiangensis]|uniref:DMT family transporter n=1 Tax=Nocardia lijiangensis TaxID=299618 RepID=UPI0008358AEF|nr:DMT family transporter [Nocardia lijiangensis]
MTHPLAIGFALVAALCIAFSAVSRQREAARVPDADLGRFGAIGSLVHRPRWWLGTVVGAAGYVFQALALGRGSVLLVQSLLVSSLLFALPLAAPLRAPRRPNPLRPADFRSTFARIGWWIGKTVVAQRFRIVGYVT